MSNYLIDARNQKQPIDKGHLRISGTNPTGELLSCNSYFLEKNGRPYFPIGGEFHFSRYPYRQWEEEIIKIKLAGIDLIPTYIFWIHHEEDEGRFDWTGNKNLRDFVDLCAKQQMRMILRIGPFAHGECRNGGLPDWLYGRPFEVRSNDPGYLHYVGRFYREIGRQVKGLLYKDGGPIIGVQLENEFTASSAKWELTTLQGDEWIPSGSGGAEHMRILKQLALEAGLDVPLYTCTGWGNAPIVEGEMLPMWGGYAFQPWLLYWNSQLTSHPPTDNYIFRDYHRNDPQYLDASYPTEQYPFACCEIGGGMQPWYNYRFVVPPESVEAMVINRLAGGCNFLGYYVFHGGSNPSGKHSYLNERCVPKICYDFQAPLGEFGQVRDSYRYLKPLHLFCRDFAELLCPMSTVLPDVAGGMQPADTETLRFGARVAVNSGFLFLTNYQDHLTTKDQENVRITLILPGEELTVPAKNSFTLRSGVNAILPFNLNLNGVLLKWATTQLVTSLRVDDEPYYFFFVPEGMAGEYCFDNSTFAAITVEEGLIGDEPNRTYISVSPGMKCKITITDRKGQRVHICTLTREQILHFWKIELWGRERVIISPDDILAGAGYLELRNRERACFELDIFPATDGNLLVDGKEIPNRGEGSFRHYRFDLPQKATLAQWEKVAPGKAVIRIPREAFTTVNELFLRIDYLGDVGNLFIDGKLIADDFCNGETWEIGLKRFYPEIANKELCLTVSPLRKGHTTLNNATLAVKEDFIGEQIAEIRSVQLIPEYRAVVLKD